MTSNSKFYIITHKELSVGYQMAQISHVVAEFVLKHPDIALNWHTKSNYVAVLEAESPDHLHELLRESIESDLTCHAFYEPDLGNVLTAIAIEPSNITQEMLRHLPTVGRSFDGSCQASLRKRESELRSLINASECVSIKL